MIKLFGDLLSALLGAMAAWMFMGAWHHDMDTIVGTACTIVVLLMFRGLAFSIEEDEG